MNIGPAHRSSTGVLYRGRASTRLGLTHPTATFRDRWYHYLGTSPTSPNYWQVSSITLYPVTSLTAVYTVAGRWATEVSWTCPLGTINRTAEINSKWPTLLPSADDGSQCAMLLYSSTTNKGHVGTGLGCPLFDVHLSYPKSGGGTTLTKPDFSWVMTNGVWDICVSGTGTYKLFLAPFRPMSPSEREPLAGNSCWVPDAGGTYWEDWTYVHTRAIGWSLVDMDGFAERSGARRITPNPVACGTNIRVRLMSCACWVPFFITQPASILTNWSYVFSAKRVAPAASNFSSISDGVTSIDGSPLSTD